MPTIGHNYFTPKLVAITLHQLLQPIPSWSQVFCARSCDQLLVGHKYLCQHLRPLEDFVQPTIIPIETLFAKSPSLTDEPLRIFPYMTVMTIGNI